MPAACRLEGLLGARQVGRRRPGAGTIRELDADVIEPEIAVNRHQFDPRTVSSVIWSLVAKTCIVLRERANAQESMQRARGSGTLPNSMADQQFL
jgi:hypothetical protein